MGMGVMEGWHVQLLGVPEAHQKGDGFGLSSAGIGLQ